MIAPDRIKAFLDDLALVCVKHQVTLSPKEFGYADPIFWIGVEEMTGDFAGFEVHADGSLETRWAGAQKDLDVAPGAVVSLDVSTATAHQRIVLERSLAEVGRPDSDRRHQPRLARRDASRHSLRPHRPRVRRRE